MTWRVRLYSTGAVLYDESEPVYFVCVRRHSVDLHVIAYGARKRLDKRLTTPCAPNGQIDLGDSGGGTHSENEPLRPHAESNVNIRRAL